MLARRHTGTVDLNLYRFRSEWHVEHEPVDVYRALEAFEEYPQWWREVRDVRRAGAERYEVFVRALLPYDLRFDATATQRDLGAGLLEIGMTGDLEGFSRWSLNPHGAGTRLTFDEEVIARKPLLRRMAAVARPVFRANHAVMMRNCRSGLDSYLSGDRTRGVP